ncbi:unnamed protein product [marine sediment metagenome]|uniref:TRAP C4-dicarboxylate transport system permease DctM subunit domain-containing protein n=1 Tax=marine sediment metagenome TaxID=412755 RepID=X1FC54_9ZZZZ
MLLSVFLGAIVFGEILGFTGVAAGIGKILTGFTTSPALVVGIVMVIGLVLGCLMSGLAIMLMLIPIAMPTIRLLGIDPIWFCTLFSLNQEMGVTSPPFGYLLFVMKGLVSKDTTMGDLYRAALPFLGCDAIAMILMILFPQIVLWLPYLAE